MTLTFPIVKSPASDFETALNMFLVSRQIKNSSDETVTWYYRRLIWFIEFAKANGVTPETLSRQTILAYIQRRLQTVTPQTVNGDIRAIRAFVRWLIREGICSSEVLSGIEKVKEPLHYPRTLSDDQIASLINAISQHIDSFYGLRDLALVCLMLDTGLRVSEAVNLKISDLDLSLGFVRVVGKGAKERMVPVGESAKAVLLRYLARRMRAVGGDYLFIITLGTKMSRQRAERRIAQWAKKAKIEGVKVTPHSLRFTFVRKWLQSGGDSLVLQRILGHSSPVTTSYYARLFASDLKDAHKRHSPIDALAPILKIPRKRIT